MTDEEMTDEEMARQYLIEMYGLRKDIELEKIQHVPPLRQEFYAYLEGLKAGEKLGFEKGVKTKVNTTTISDCPAKFVWHEVADGYLPPVVIGCCSIDVLTDSGRLAYYNYDDNCWVDSNDIDEIDTPKAWCEIPIFKEE